MRPEDQSGNGQCRAFEEEWPPLARRLQVVLRNRKVSSGLTEDIVQETGLRLFEIWERVDPEREPWPLALTIALNIVRDQIRTASRRQQIVPHEEFIEHSAERSALARVELVQISEALEHLTSAQRSALLAEVGLEADPLENSSALKMLRMRARRRLRDLIEGASGVVGALELGIQKFTRTGAVYLGEQLAPCLSLAAGAICVATFTTSGAPAQAVPYYSTEPNAAFTRMERSITPSLGNSVARAYESAVGTGSGRSSVFPRIGAAGDESRGPKELARTSRERTGRRGASPKLQPSTSHEGRATVGSDGYTVGGRVGARAAGHSVEASFDSSGRSNRPSDSCRKRVPPASRCSTEPPAAVDARARAELDEKGIELGVGGKRSS